MHPEVYHDPSEWPTWTDEVRFAPTEADQAEAARLFGEAEDPQDTFDAWLASLPDQDFVDITRAIDVIRRVMKTAWRPLPVPVLAGWLDLE